MNPKTLRFSPFVLTPLLAGAPWPSVARADCTFVSSGNVPLTDLPGDGGLYPEAASAPPGPHFTHPSPSGRAKVGEQLFAFFATRPETTPWFIATPGPGAPACEAQASVQQGDSPLAVDFESGAGDDGEITGAWWTFGDGTFAVGDSASKVFWLDGSHDVRLTVVDDEGNASTCAVQIEVGESGGGQAGTDSGADSGSPDADDTGQPEDGATSEDDGGTGGPSGEIGSDKGTTSTEGTSGGGSVPSADDGTGGASCGCTSRPPNAPWPWLLGLLGVGRCRRRRRPALSRSPTRPSRCPRGSWDAARPSQ